MKGAQGLQSVTFVVVDEEGFDELVSAPRQCCGGNIDAHAGEDAFGEGYGSLVLVYISYSGFEVDVARAANVEAVIRFYWRVAAVLSQCFVKLVIRLRLAMILAFPQV